MLLNEDELRKRVYKLHSAMKSAAGPKKWKSGRRMGKLRRVGIELSFTKEDLWQHALNQVGEGVVACPYCVQAGRNIRFISLETFVFDHHVPKSRGGSWELSNLQACCRDCNTQKGELTFEFFIYLIGAIEKWKDYLDRDRIYKVLDGQGWAHQFHKDSAKAAPVTDGMNMEF